MHDTYWVTRDSSNGKLADVVEVWLSRPVRQVKPDGSVTWLSSDATGVGGRHAVWTLEYCKSYIYVVPDTDRENIMVGADAP